MKIYVRTLTGAVITLDIEDQGEIEKVKQEIREDKSKTKDEKENDERK